VKVAAAPKPAKKPAVKKTYVTLPRTAKAWGVTGRALPL
jgi:hypothetical protein